MLVIYSLKNAEKKMLLSIKQGEGGLSVMEYSIKNNAVIFGNLPLAFYFLFPNISVKKCHCSRLPGSCLKVCVLVVDSVLNQLQCNPNLG